MFEGFGEAEDKASTSRKPVPLSNRAHRKQRAEEEATRRAATAKGSSDASPAAVVSAQRQPPNELSSVTPTTCGSCGDDFVQLFEAGLEASRSALASTTRFAALAAALPAGGQQAGDEQRASKFGSGIHAARQQRQLDRADALVAKHQADREAEKGDASLAQVDREVGVFLTAAYRKRMAERNAGEIADRESVANTTFLQGHQDQPASGVVVQRGGIEQAVLSPVESEETKDPFATTTLAVENGTGTADPEAALVEVARARAAKRALRAKRTLDEAALDAKAALFRRVQEDWQRTLA